MQSQRSKSREGAVSPLPTYADLSLSVIKLKLTLSIHSCYPGDPNQLWVFTVPFLQSLEALGLHNALLRSQLSPTGQHVSSGQPA